jgi:selenocysteine-specific elongation factor
MTLAEQDAFEPTPRIDVRLDLLPDARALRQGGRVRFHSGTAEILGRVTLAEPRGTEAQLEGEARARAAATYARIHLEAPAVVTRGDRFIIRAYSPVATIGGGVVLDPRPVRGGVRSAAGVQRFRRIEISAADPDLALAVLVDEGGGAGLPVAALVSRAGLSYEAADQAVMGLVAGGTASLVGDLLVSTRVRAELGTALVAALQAHHRAQPLSGGMPREEARERLFRRVPSAVFEAVVGDLVAARRLVARERLALEGHRVSLTPEEARVQAALERVYRDAKLTPPDLAAAASAAGADLGLAERMIALMVRGRSLVKIETLVFHPASLDDLKADVRRLKGGGGRVDVASFKERYGVTRKYAIPLLEYLDRERVTRRMGESRIVL